MTSATIYYKVDAGNYQSMPWTGSLAPNATVSVSLPVQTLTVGSHVIIDSVTNPNNSADINGGNAVSFVRVSVHDNTPNNLPLATGFENNGTLPTNWILLDENGNGSNFLIAFANASNIGQNNSKYTLYHNNYNYSAGETNLAILPHPNLSGAGAKSLDFWVAYAQYQAENDKLEVVYSTNCGSSWTSVWSKQGSALATAPATQANFVPAQNQWKLKSIDMSSVPANAMIAFRATSAFGNNLFIDNVNLRSGAPVSVGTVTTVAGVTVYPNPANNATNVSIMLDKSATVNGVVLDVTGRVLASFANGTYAAGRQTFEVNTASLPAGIYTVKMDVDGKSVTERITVAH
jgi:hypothetical protein